MLVLQMDAQEDKVSYYLFDSSWKKTDSMGNARYALRTALLGDTCEQWDTYNVYGPLIKIETFKKNKKKTAHGRSSWYGQDGRIDSMGSYTNGIMEGDWYFYNDTGGVHYKRHFSKGKLLWEKDYSLVIPDKNKDSANGYLEATFKGVTGSWQRYIIKNLRYPQLGVDQEIEGNVHVRFIVDENGNIEDPWIEKSVEMSLDDEALRLIKSSPPWTPASQDGKKVRAYKIQPIYYRLK